MNMHVNAAALAVNAEAAPKVRLAVEEDIPQLVAMGRELHRENGLMPISETRIYQMARRAVARDRVICGVIGPVGGIEGIIVIMVGQFWYTDFPHLEELFAYIKPEFRRSNRAKALVEFAKKSAIELNAPLLIGIVSNKQTEAKIRLYRRQLGDPAGAYFLYNAKTGA
jgi:GNAT superfamily N-acetyltransferase